MLNSNFLIGITVKMTSLFGLIVNFIFQINIVRLIMTVLNENGEAILKNKEIADTFNNYFGSIKVLICRH